MDRKTFLKKSVLTGTALLSAPAILKAGRNDQINFAVAGIRSRGRALCEAIHFSPNTKITWFCDVDDTIIEEHQKWHQETIGYVPKLEKDFRKLIEHPDIDVIAIATPEHWHAPMAIMAMEAGKHVYIEKPCSHNPHENELLVAAQKKYGKHCQMGNQQRSAVTSQKGIQEIHDGIIGEAYYGKAWYSNTRGSIGVGNEIPVPATLDWDLWQGPAPRRSYHDNVHPYNWHWFKDWGTGEIHNNGTHEIDICRWALNVKLPDRVTSSGGRYHFDDDWEFYDTQLAGFQFGSHKLINWEGKSCNGKTFYGRGRGAMIYGTKGSMLLDRGGIILYDLDGNIIKEEREPEKGATDTADTQGFDTLTVNHMTNMVEAIRNGEQLHAPIADASISTMLCHYGNIAQEVGGSIDIDTTSGKIVNNNEAQKYWKREYEQGWEPRI